MEEIQLTLDDSNNRKLENLVRSNKIIGPLDEFLSISRTFPDLLNNKPIGVKCKALKDLKKGMINKDVAAKYGVPKNTLSAWVKNKHKLATFLEKKGMSSSRKSTPCGSQDQIYKTVFH